MINNPESYFTVDKPQITVNLTYDKEKLNKDVKEFKESLQNLRDLFDKDFCLVVSKKKIKLMFEE